jgi:hypothetical protein
MLHYELNYYNKIRKKATVDNLISVDAWLHEIRTGDSFGQIIRKAREFGKYSNKVEYDEIKVNQLPAVTWNFLFNGYKEDSKIAGATGFLYFDIDIPGFEIGQLDKSKIFCFFKSLSNEGYSIVTRVNGLTPENYENIYWSLANELKISNHLDKGAKKMSQYTVLTLDPYLFLNESCMVFECKDYTSSGLPKKVSLSNNTLSLKVKKKKVLRLDDSFLKTEKYVIRMTNATDYVPDGKEFQVFEEMIDTTKIWIPKIILNTKRNTTLSTLLSNMLILNPDIPPGNAYKWLEGINNSNCEIPVSKKELDCIFKSNWQKKGIYQAAQNHQRKVVFHKDSEKTPKEKRSITRKEIGKLQVKRKKEIITELLEELIIEEKITNSVIAKKLNFPEVTVKRYTKSLRGNISERNELNSIEFSNRDYAMHVEEIYKESCSKDLLNEEELKIYYEDLQHYFERFERERLVA